jgi:uncharacterized protein (DUF736 family)
MFNADKVSGRVRTLLVDIDVVVVDCPIPTQLLR